MYSIILFIIYLQASHVQYYSVYYISANEQAINENWLLASKVDVVIVTQEDLRLVDINTYV